MTRTLEAITTNYRRFTKNQVLTESHLNQIVDFFDDQIRLSRTHLSGVGIVCGFQVSCDDTKKEVTITQGIGLTTDGDMFHLYDIDKDDRFSIDLEQQLFKAFKPYDNSRADYRPFFYRNQAQLALYELQATVDSEDGQSKSLSEFPASLKDMVALLYLETYVEETDLCTTLGCDNQGENRVSNHKVLLVSKVDAAHIMSYDPSISKNRYSQLYYDLPEIQMERLVAAPKIFKDYETLKRSFVEVMKAGGPADTLKSGFETLLAPDAVHAPALLTQIKSQFDALFNFPEDDAPEDVQYRYDLLKDLIATYNEIREALLRVDTAECFSGYEDFPKHLLLGELEKDGYCHEYRHAFYKSPILGQLEINTCTTCDPIELEYTISSQNSDIDCEDASGEARSNHIVFLIDESGSFNRQKVFVKDALRSYLDSVKNTNLFVSLIGMSSNINNTRKDHLIHKPAGDPALLNWVNSIYGTPATQGGGGSDYWASGYQVVLQSILDDTEVPNPAIVVLLGDEGPGPYSPTSHGVTLERAGAIKRETKLFQYIVDSDRSGSLSGIATGAVPSTAVVSIDGESDLDTTDYFVAADFSDLEFKIRNLNEALINSNILCPKPTEDETTVPDSGEVVTCYKYSPSEQKLFSLIKRAALQLSNYNSDYDFVKVTPSLALGDLSKKSIPFYYDVGEQMIAHWDFDKTIMGRQRMNLSYHSGALAIKNPLEYCVDNNFYRVEGHLGRNYLEVIERINSVKKKHSLGFNIVALPLNARDVVGLDYKEYYLQKNYGLEHLAGVPEGGTLVLFYLDEPTFIGEGDGDFEVSRVALLGRTAKPVVADFCLPYLCCDENEMDACLPDEVVCFDEDTQPIPFEVHPPNATVVADVARGLNGGVVRRKDGSYVFDARRVSKELHGMRIKFLVANQRSKFGVKVFEKAKVSVSTSIAYESNRRVAIITFAVRETFGIDNYFWDFGDGSSSSEAPDGSGRVSHRYDVPGDRDIVIYPKLTIRKGLCEQEVSINPVLIEGRPYYYYYYYGNNINFASESDDSALFMSIGEL